MNLENLPAVTDKADFLAHAEMLVDESLAWYGQLADSMEIHNNTTAAAQFRELEGMERQQLQWIATRAAGLTLPAIAPWDFAWDIYSEPATSGFSEIDYLSSEACALKAALHYEHHAEKLFRQVAAQTKDPDVKQIANEMAEMQQEEINLLQQRLSELPQEAHELVEDLDPPNIAE
jgi:hypothetical protein